MNRAALAFRSLGGADAAACAAVHAQAFSPPWSAADFRDAAARGDRIGTGAVRGTALAGLVVSRFVGDEADLLTIAVARDTRRAGVATALLGAHFSALGQVRVARVFLEVGANNHAARALYAAFGFVAVGARPNYYGGNAPGGADALVLRCDL